MTDSQLEKQIAECKTFLADTEKEFLNLKFRRDYRRRKMLSLEQRLFDRRQGQLDLMEHGSGDAENQTRKIP